MKKSNKPIKSPLNAFMNVNPIRWLYKSYIYLLMCLNGISVFTLFVILTYQPDIAEKLNYPVGSVKILTVISILNIFCCLKLLAHRRWAFWLYCIVTFVGVFYSWHFTQSLQLDVALMKTILPLFNIGLLFIFLRMGGKRSAWNELK